VKTVDIKPHTVPIEDVLVGRRHSRDLGNIDELARSIEEVGLLHPIVVRPDGTLIAGQRRLEAGKVLGWQSIPANVVDLTEIMRGEFAENAMRKSFLLSEIDAIRRELEPIEHDTHIANWLERHQPQSTKLTKMQIAIDQEFQRLIPPLLPEELHQLEANILRDGCQEPLSIWQGLLIDGHNRLKICQQHDKPFKVKEIALPDREHVKLWIAERQLGRRNLSDDQRATVANDRREILSDTASITA
jgi:ParB/RepB/Spo0J family partition protein